MKHRASLSKGSEGGANGPLQSTVPPQRSVIRPRSHPSTPEAPGFISCRDKNRFFTWVRGDVGPVSGGSEEVRGAEMARFLLNVESPAGCLKGKISPAEQLLTQVIHHRYSSTKIRRRRHSHIQPSSWAQVKSGLTVAVPRLPWETRFPPTTERMVVS